MGDTRRLTRRALLAQAAAAAALPAFAAGAIVPREDEAARGQAEPSPSPASKALPPLPDGTRPFSAGEQLRYSVAFEGVTAGEATLAVVGPCSIGTQSGLLVRYTGETTGLARRIYRFQDRIDTLLDPGDLYTRRYESWSEQRSRRRHRIVVFEPKSGRFVRTEEGGDTITGPLGREVVDGLGLVYHLRSRLLSPGTRITVPIYRKQEIVLVTFGVAGPEATDTPTGRFETVRVRPVAAARDQGGEATSTEGGLFGGSGSMWFTSDARRLPVRLVGSARFGSIDARLTDLSLPPA